MPERLYAKVQHATNIGAGFAEYAPTDSLNNYLRDWRKAHLLLDRQIDVLQELVTQRQTAEQKGQLP